MHISIIIFIFVPYQLKIDTMKHLVGTFNERQLIAKEDKVAVEKAQKETGLTYVDTKLNHKKKTITIWLISNEEYYNSNKL